MSPLTLNWRQLASLEVGGAICLPVIMVGHALCMKYGLHSALLGIIAGNVVLLLLGFISAHISVRKRKSTPENARDYFGMRGVKLFAAVLLLCKLCWFALQLRVMSQSFLEMVGGSSPTKMILCNVVFGALIIGLARYGLKALSFLSSASIPLMIATLAMATFGVSNHAGSQSVIAGPITVEAVSVAIAAAITAVIDMPTYFRLARSKKDAYIAVLLLFGLALPLIEGVGLFLAFRNPQETIVATFLGGNVLWNIWVTLFFILAAWTTNNTNLYSATVCADALKGGIAEPKRVLLLGVVAMALSMAPFLASFTTVLQIMGIGVGAMGGVLLMLGLRCDRLKKNTIPILCWGIGATLGFLSLAGVFSLTSVALLDSFLGSAVLTLISTLSVRVKEAA